MHVAKVLEGLKSNDLRKKLIHHPIFDEIRSGTFSRSDVAVLLGQWWHPVHYFPTFLSRAISVVPELETKTAISSILFQELGEGKAERAHERMYLETMSAAGFSSDEISTAEQLPTTRRLVEGYHKASSEACGALGFVYGTEVADLAMVSGVGAAVRQVTGVKSLPWVDIHVVQEPNHVDKASDALSTNVSDKDYSQVVANAEEVWRLWIAFFAELSRARIRATDSNMPNVHA